jgi:hypothetical protein
MQNAVYRYADQDAAWISSSGTLRCTLAEEVLLLLKSSDFIMHDLLHAFDDIADTASPPFNDFQVGWVVV